MDPIKDLTLDDVDLAKPIDLKTIAKKSYTSFNELREDFNWYTHNLLVKHRSNRSVTRAVKELKGILDGEINNIILCYQCYRSTYYHPEQPITTICNPPHMLVWVDCAEYSYWPGKLIQCENNEKATVRFFGDWSIATVSIKNCFMFTEEIPVNSHGTATGPTFQLAKHVIYIPSFY